MLGIDTLHRGRSLLGAADDAEVLPERTAGTGAGFAGIAVPDAHDRFAGEKAVLATSCFHEDCLLDSHCS